MRVRTKSVATGSIFALSLLVAVGCGDGRLPVYPVSGTVTFDGKPLGKAEIWLVPKSEVALKAETIVRPYAMSGPDGAFTTSTYLTGDGAPPGEYGVMVLWAGGTQTASDDMEEQPPEAPTKSKPAKQPPFPVKYRTPATSGLSATVREAPNQLSLELKSK